LNKFLKNFNFFYLLKIKESDLKELSKNANEYGSEFVDIFYKTFDSKRHVNSWQNGIMFFF
jgi:hypothetical protein